VNPARPIDVRGPIGRSASDAGIKRLVRFSAAPRWRSFLGSSRRRYAADGTVSEIDGRSTLYPGITDRSRVRASSPPESGEDCGNPRSEAALVADQSMLPGRVGQVPTDGGKAYTPHITQA
jgi:hypothetical protein